MPYISKHRAARKTSLTTRVIGTAVTGGAVIFGGMATAPSASAASSDVWDRVAACESGGNWSIATGNGFYGGLQFTPSSWRAAGGTRYASMPHRATKAQQIAAAQNLLRQQGPGAWPVCSKKAGLNRSNGLASSGGASTASRSATRTVKAKAVNAPVRGLASRDTVRDLQSWTGAKRTGAWNASTTRALQAKVGANVDGVVGPETVRKTERAIGAKASGAGYFTSATMKKLKNFVASV